MSSRPPPSTHSTYERAQCLVSVIHVRCTAGLTRDIMVGPCVVPVVHDMPLLAAVLHNQIRHNVVGSDEWSLGEGDVEPAIAGHVEYLAKYKITHG